MTLWVQGTEEEGTRLILDTDTLRGLGHGGASQAAACFAALLRRAVAGEDVSAAYEKLGESINTEIWAKRVFGPPPPPLAREVVPEDPPALGGVQMEINYAIQAVRGGPIKIGRTQGRAFKRLKELQVSHPDKLRVIAEWPARPGDEALAHKRWAEIHIRGEWFEDTPELMEWIYEKKTGGFEPNYGEDLG